jgi:polyhydroxybutyrate depolymerase
MKRFSLRLIMLVAIFFHISIVYAGEKTPGITGLMQHNTMQIDGIERTYDLYIPTGLGTTSHPLIFLLHGHGGSVSQLTGQNGNAAPHKVWLEIAECAKLILAIPSGSLSLSPEGNLGWNDCRADAETNPKTDDVKFIGELIQTVARSYPVDRSRIFASGISNGGNMALRLALELSDQFAAVAVVASAMPKVNECDPPAHPVSVLFMNGTADPLLPYEGGEVAKAWGKRGSVISTDASVHYWITHNQTKTEPEVKQFPQRKRGDRSSVTRYRYSGGKADTAVVLYKVDGGGHTEPSIKERYSGPFELVVGSQNGDIEMADEVWYFFKDKQKRQ